HPPVPAATIPKRIYIVDNIRPVFFAVFLMVLACAPARQTAPGNAAVDGRTPGPVSTSTSDSGSVSDRASAAAATPGSIPSAKPNIIVIFCDDLGYGDLSVFGHPTIKTPQLDRMAAQGMKLTNF